MSDEDDDDDTGPEGACSDDEEQAADSLAGESGSSWLLKPPTSCYGEHSELAALNSFRPARKGEPGYSATDVRYYQSLNRYANIYIQTKALNAADVMTWVERAEGDGNVTFIPSKIIDFLKFVEDSPSASSGVFEMLKKASAWWTKKQVPTHPLGWSGN